MKEDQEIVRRTLVAGVLDFQHVGFTALKCVSAEPRHNTLLASLAAAMKNSVNFADVH